MFRELGYDLIGFEREVGIVFGVGIGVVNSEFAIVTVKPQKPNFQFSFPMV